MAVHIKLSLQHESWPCTSSARSYGSPGHVQTERSPFFCDQHLCYRRDNAMIQMPERAVCPQACVRPHHERQNEILVCVCVCVCVGVCIHICVTWRRTRVTYMCMQILTEICVFVHSNSCTYFNAQFECDYARTQTHTNYLLPTVHRHVYVTIAIET